MEPAEKPPKRAHLGNQHGQSYYSRDERPPAAIATAPSTARTYGSQPASQSPATVAASASARAASGHGTVSLAAGAAEAAVPLAAAAARAFACSSATTRRVRSANSGNGPSGQVGKSTLTRSTGRGLPSSSSVMTCARPTPSRREWSIRVRELLGNDLRHVIPRLRHEIDSDSLGADQAARFALSAARAVPGNGEEQVRFVEKEAPAAAAPRPLLPGAAQRAGKASTEGKRRKRRAAI